MKVILNENVTDGTITINKTEEYSVIGIQVINKESFFVVENKEGQWVRVKKDKVTIKHDNI